MLLASTLSANANPQLQDDFYTYVNADWLQNTPIPENLPGLDNFAELTIKVNGQIRDTLEELGKSKSALKPYEQKLVDLHHSYINMDQRNALGVKPLEAEFKLIDEANDHQRLALAFMELQKSGVAGPLVVAVAIDPKNSTRYTAMVIQYGLGPSQAILVGEDERSQKMRSLYQEHIANLFKLAGIADGEKRAANVLDLEQKLAQLQWTPAQNRDPQKTYNPFTVAQLQKTLSHFPVKEMLSTLGFTPESDMVVRQPSYLDGLNQLFAETDVSVWQDYLRIRVLSERASVLSQAFIDEGTAYKTRQGLTAKEMDQWLQAILFLEDKVDMLAGRIYVEHHFSDTDLQRITEIVNIIKEQYRLAITGSTFFSEATRKEALDKLDKMRFYLGYPKKWKDYSSLEIDPEDLTGNVRHIAIFNHKFMMDKLKKPVDPDEWAASPSQVNAFYQPSANKFVLMASILQPPFFDAKWSEAAQLGGIGFIIGHEIGHGFDDQGSQYDANGNLRNWWTDEDRAKFNAVAKRTVEQANAYEILPGHFLNGQLELGEILGDLNGLHIAHRANRRIAENSKLDLEKADREFFGQAAKVYRNNLREAILLKFLETDGHPPGKYRVNGTFPQLDAFHELYKTKPGDGMYLAPENRLKIW